MYVHMKHLSMSVQIKLFYCMKLVIPHHGCHHVKIHQVTINHNNISNKLHAISPKGNTIKVKTTGTIGMNSRQLNNNLLRAPLRLP